MPQVITTAKESTRYTGSGERPRVGDKVMKLSALPWRPICSGEITTRQWFQYAREIDLDGVELMDGWFNRQRHNLNSITSEIFRQREKIFHPSILRETKRELADYGHRVSMLTIHNRFCRFGREEQQRELDAIRLSMDVAKEFGTDKLRVIAAGWPLTGEQISYREAMEACVDTIRQCVEAAAAEGVYLLLENHPGLSADVEGYAEILSRVDSPYFRANLDCKNTMRTDKQPTEFLAREEITNRLMCLHVDNFIETSCGWDRSTSVDEGKVDIRAALELVKESEYDGWLSIEYGGSRIEQVERSVRFVRRAWDEL